jgi:hypothetical protein
MVTKDSLVPSEDGRNGGRQSHRAGQESKRIQEDHEGIQIATWSRTIEGTGPKESRDLVAEQEE